MNLGSFQVVLPAVALAITDPEVFTIAPPVYANGPLVVGGRGIGMIETVDAIRIVRVSAVEIVALTRLDSVSNFPCFTSQVSS